MNHLTKLCKAQGWTQETVSGLLPSHPAKDTVFRWMNDYPKNITDNDLLLLRYIAKYGRLIEIVG